MAPEPHDLISELLGRKTEEKERAREKEKREKIKERVGGGSALLSSMVAPCFL